MTTNRLEAKPIVTVQTPYGKNSTLRDIPRFLCQDPVQRYASIETLARNGRTARCS